MEYALQWHIPQRVLHLKVSGDVSLEDLEHFNNDLSHYLDEGVAPVHLVSEGENIRRVPTNLMQIKKTTTFLQHPNMGWIIVIQEKHNPLTSFIVSVATQAAGMKLRQVKSVADGLDTLDHIEHFLGPTHQS